MQCDTLESHGVVAHLGERIAGSDEVASSSLVVSTFFYANSGSAPAEHLKNRTPDAVLPDRL